MATSPIEVQVGLLLLTASWQAGLLALMIAAICRLTASRISPRWQFALWGLVFVRLACPLLPASPLSVWNLLAASDQKTSVANKPTPAEVKLAPSRQGDFSPPSETSPGTASSRSTVPQDLSSPARDVSTAPQ